MTQLRLGLDFGGTKVAVGVVALTAPETGSAQAGRGCAVLASRRVPTREIGDGEALLERVARLAEETCAAAGVRPAEVDGVGVALPGPFDPGTQRLLAAPSLPGLVQLPIVEFFAERWNGKGKRWARAENDANAAALGEAFYGAGRGARVICYFTVSTGIGGGVVVEGRLFRGASGQAGEFGHLKLRSDGPRCSCGDRGCLEPLASGSAIGQRAQEALAASGAEESLLAECATAITAERVAAAARHGDWLASQIWGQAMADLGAGIATVVNLFNPDVVIIGGGVSRSPDLLLPAVRHVVMERAMPAPAQAARIEVAVLGDDVGIIGAAALFDEREY